MLCDLNVVVHSNLSDPYTHPFPKHLFKPYFKTGTWEELIFGITQFGWFWVLIITGSSLNAFDRYYPTKNSYWHEAVYFSQQLYFMNCKAYIEWNGLRLGWAFAEFLNINQYISETWVLFFVCFWAPNFLFFDIFMKENILEDISQPPSEEWSSVPMQSSSWSDKNFSWIPDCLLVFWRQRENDG